MKRFAAPIGRFLLALSVFLVLPAASVLAGFQFLGPWFVAQEYARPGFPPAERFQPAERLALAQQTVRDLAAPDGAQRLRALRTGGEPVYNEREVGHLVDVMAVLDLCRGVAAVGGMICLVALAAAVVRPAWRRPVARSAFRGSAALLAVLGVLLVGAVTSFDTFFVRFHQVLFKPDTWMFEWTDSLIQFYPVQLWMDFFYQLGALFVVEALIVAGLALLYLRRGENEAEPPSSQRAPRRRQG